MTPDVTDLVAFDLLGVVEVPPCSVVHSKPLVMPKYRASPSAALGVIRAGGSRAR